MVITVASDGKRSSFNSVALDGWRERERERKREQEKEKEGDDCNENRFQ